MKRFLLVRYQRSNAGETEGQEHHATYEHEQTLHRHGLRQRRIAKSTANAAFLAYGEVSRH
jgi:hypothetical protein